MKLTKKITALFIAAALVLPITGCGLAGIAGLLGDVSDNVNAAANEILSEPRQNNGGTAAPAESAKPAASNTNTTAADEQARFDTFLNDWLSEFKELNSIDKQFLFSEHTFEDSQQTGYEPITKQSWDEDVADTQAKLDELKSFDAGKLDDESKITLDVLTDVTERMLLNKDYYYLYNNYLNLDGDLMQMPTWLSVLDVKGSDDIEAVFNMYNWLPDMTDNYISLELERQQNGTGLSKQSLIRAAQGARDIVSADPNLFESVLNAKIDATNGLTDAQKQDYKQQNARLVADKVIPSYQKVTDALYNIIDNYGEEPDFTGLASKTGGADYYEVLMKQNGIDMTPEEAMKYLKWQFDYYQEQILSLLENDAELLDKYLESISSSTALSGDSSSEEIIDTLAEKIKPDFPDIGDVPYTTKTVPAELRLPNTLAFYILRPVDQPSGESATIYINDEDTASDFLTLAHEGFPGHMYQDTYAQRLGRPEVRMILDRGLNAFTEGWGIYSEVISSQYVDEADRDFARILALDKLTNGIIMAYVDIGVNYYGWDKEQAVKQLNDTFGLALTTEGEFDLVYEMICESPAQLVAYYLGGSRLLDYRIYAEKQLGDAFSAKDYHSAILNVAPASLPAIEKVVGEYIESAKAGAAQPTQQAA